MMKISLESPKQDEVAKLIDELDAYHIPLYPTESHHGIDLDALANDNVLFAVVRDDSGTAVACGAIVLETTYGELKRFYTSPQLRGKGIARMLLSFLEQKATNRGFNEFKLETGYLQAEAISLYSLCGYERGGPFGSYSDDPASIFMHKKPST